MPTATLNGHPVRNTTPYSPVRVQADTPVQAVQPADSGQPVQVDRLKLYGQRAVLSTVAVLLTGIVLSPLALSAEHVMEWAADRTGLGLSGQWPWVVFYALDATALICVLLSLYATWRAEAGTVFRMLVWVIAGLSAFANYRFAQRPGSPGDAFWFFPAMSLSAPLLLEVVLHKVRHWVKQAEGRTASPMPSFGVARWIPGVGAFRETYGAWRIARLKGISRPATAVAEYRRLDCGWRVLRAIQSEHRTAQTPVRPDSRTTDNPVRTKPVQPVRKPTQKPVRPDSPVQASDEQLLVQIREQFPGQIPSGNKIRTTFGVRYETAKRVREQLLEEKENTHV